VCLCVFGVVATQEKVNVSVISPRDRPSLRAVFELGLQTDELDSEALEAADHALRQGHLALLQIQVPGKGNEPVSVVLSAPYQK